MNQTQILDNYKFAPDIQVGSRNPTPLLHLLALTTVSSLNVKVKLDNIRIPSKFGVEPIYNFKEMSTFTIAPVKKYVK